MAAARAEPPQNGPATPIRVVVWDERQPEQKQAYDTFLGNEIAATLTGRPVKVVYIRPGHETFPVWKDERMLRLLENAIRWGRAAE